MHFGEHLMIDGYNGELNLLDSQELVTKCLTELPQLLHMKILGGPEVYHAEPNNFKDPGGWTGVVTINESHLSIHTFPRRGFVSIDVYTCHNGLDQNFICSYFKEAFGLKELETNFVKRGTKYPEQNIY